MKCMICGAPATVFVTQTVNGRTRQQFLCDSCARQRENGLYIQSRQRQRQKQNTVCPKCGTRLDEFLKKLALNDFEFCKFFLDRLFFIK